jgi:hypothetical protein
MAHRFVSGIDDDAIGYAAESLRLLRAEIGRRAPRIKALDPRICPEKRVTREIAARRSLRLQPIVCIIDEAQNLFAHPKHGKQAGDDAEFIIKVGPAMVAAAILGPVLHLVLLALTVAGVILLGGLVGLVLWHVHRRLGGLPVWQRTRHIQPQRQRRPVPQAQQPELGQGGQHLHLHLGGLTPAERAEVMRQLRGGRPGR